MTRQLSRLSARTVSTATAPGYHADGGGLYLQITTTGARSWIFRYSRAKRAREMGLGSLTATSLAEARQHARLCRQQLAEGLDPIETRRKQRAAQRLAEASGVTFDECAEAYIEAHQAEWRNAKHAAQWRSTLSTYASPKIGSLPVQAIDTDRVMAVLEPIWLTKTETASRVRGRIETVLDWAAVRSYRQGDNPARWRGHLDHLLSGRNKAAPVTHHPALPYEDMAAFMRQLGEQGGAAAPALEFAILTAARTGEVIGATWQEIDLAARLWTIPGSRMKAGLEHRVPLSDSAMAILEKMQAVQQSEFIFPGQREGRPLSNMAMAQLLKRMHRDNITVHGFRSTFRDWVADLSRFPREVGEMALAHTLRDKTEAAYMRTDLLEKRRAMMEDWAAYCLPRPGTP